MSDSKIINFPHCVAKSVSLAQCEIFKKIHFHCFSVILGFIFKCGNMTNSLTQTKNSWNQFCSRLFSKSVVFTEVLSFSFCIIWHKNWPSNYEISWLILGKFGMSLIFHICSSYKPNWDYLISKGSLLKISKNKPPNFVIGQTASKSVIIHTSDVKYLGIQMTRKPEKILKSWGLENFCVLTYFLGLWHNWQHINPVFHINLRKHSVEIS